MQAQSDFVLGVDLGTSSCKAVAFTLDGRKVSSGSSAYPTLIDERGGARQDPEDWWVAAQSAIADTARLAPPGRLLGIGLSGQIGTHVLVDRAFRPIADAWTWQDRGAASALRQLAETIDAESMSADLQTWLPPGPAWPLPRLMWLRDSFPELFARAHAITQPKDIVIQRLTGALVSDASSWRGIVKPDGAVHQGALDLLGLPGLLPRIDSPTARAGTVLPDVADRLGIAQGIPVFIGWNDFNCALVGTGVANNGDGFLIAGTSEHIGILARDPVRNGTINSVPYLASWDTDSFVNYGVSSNGGSISAWLGSTYLSGVREGAARNQRIADLAEPISAGTDGLLFLPYLHGERSPVWDVAASAAYTGLRSTHGLGHLMRAALEGVAFNLRQIRDASPSPHDPTRALRASGGPTGMLLWNSIKASVLHTPLAIMEERNSAALGAAILAAVGAGSFSSPAAAMAEMTRVSEIVEPVEGMVNAYDHAFDRYSTIYPALTNSQSTKIRSA